MQPKLVKNGVFATLLVLVFSLSYVVQVEAVIVKADRVVGGQPSRFYPLKQRFLNFWARPVGKVCVLGAGVVSLVALGLGIRAALRYFNQPIPVAMPEEHPGAGFEGDLASNRLVSEVLETNPDRAATVPDPSATNPNVRTFAPGSKRDELSPPNNMRDRNELPDIFHQPITDQPFDYQPLLQDITPGQPLSDAEKALVSGVVSGVASYKGGDCTMKDSEGKAITICSPKGEEMWWQMPGMDLKAQIRSQGGGDKKTVNLHTDKHGTPIAESYVTHGGITFTEGQIPETVTLKGVDGKEGLTVNNLNKLPQPQIYVDSDLWTEEQFKAFSEHYKFGSLYKHGNHARPMDDPGKEIPKLAEHMKQMRKRVGLDHAPATFFLSGACHAQQGIFFADADEKGNYSMKKGPIDANDPKQQMTFLYAAGLDLKAQAAVREKTKQACDFSKPENQAFMKKCVTSMWKSIFHAAEAQECKAVCIPPIGMAIFLDEFSLPNKKWIKQTYIQSLGEVAAKYPQIETTFCAGGDFKELCAPLEKRLKNFHCSAVDSNVTADRLNRKGIKAAAVVAGDAGPLAGANDLGMYCSSAPHTSSDEGLASLSTLIRGSKGLSPQAWESPVMIK